MVSKWSVDTLYKASVVSQDIGDWIDFESFRRHRGLAPLRNEVGYSVQQLQGTDNRCEKASLKQCSAISTALDD